MQCMWQPLLSSMDGDNTQLMHLTASPLHCEDSKHSGGFRGWGGGGGLGGQNRNLIIAIADWLLQ